ncbi:hypothetical protein ES703_106883 [subsurface metagenome]
MAWFMGIDLGSGTTKGVITKDGEPLAYHLLPSGVNYRTAAQKLREKLLAKVALSAEDIAYIITTGSTLLADYKVNHLPLFTESNHLARLPSYINNCPHRGENSAYSSGAAADISNLLTTERNATSPMAGGYSVGYILRR